ncbi:tyrosine-type recombinase/integrase [Streptomyces mirabilis]|uniref:tyrosine-type recombinase/integrase n=1 Tax=Streptomyces mirabilis TaxID=68239 RepID=UPI00201E0CD0|nr:tyrosine-type recombinase/integrase [Streptomyces mirabilis]
MPTASTYDYHFRKGCLAAGLVGSQGRPKYTPRTLRDFFASTALANGIPIHEVSRWLGHRSIKVTVDIYGHLVPRACGADAGRSCRTPCGRRPRACWRQTMWCWMRWRRPDGAGYDQPRACSRRWEHCTQRSASMSSR